MTYTQKLLKTFADLVFPDDGQWIGTWNVTCQRDAVTDDSDDFL